ncbi:hypothetical protein ONE63_001906 [Megalurothrips usitatus]|uniref:Uncharacterized protein n=1 Tax=Megalurothrips usitatus TaxID=439358 RepID=A0AAV7XGN8_9NEOP|nr:hypothetical protein ONE63_001906 [Megalurothrips usitatus]
MFENVPNVTLDLTKDKIMVEDDEYLRKLSQLLAETPADTLQLSLWWELADLLAPYTTSEMRQLKRRYLEIASGTSAAKTRESVCTETVNGLMGMAASYHLADAAYLRTTGEKEWLLRPKDLNEYYDGLNLTKDAFLDDMLLYQQLITTSVLSQLRRVNDEDGWATDPTDVNAFHTFQSNAVTIPAGILQFPFYDLGLEALNYGAIGSILGHELTHGFDSYGRLFDRDGNMRPWWSNGTVAEYENRTACFVKQYGDYFLPEVEMNVDGELTLGENIADNGGLHESVRAYRRYLARHRLTEPLLPGMANYTHEQLLFLSYVHVWCESWTDESLRWSLEDEHAPNRVRTWGTLSNSEDFARAWGCGRGTGMNPDRRRCRLW